MTVFNLPRLACSVGAVLLLAACAERHIVTADEQILVVVEEITERDGEAQAWVQYVFPRPTPVAEPGGAEATSMSTQAVFRCAEGTWAKTREDLTTAAGETISSQTPRPTFTRPTRGTLAESVFKAVCDPAARSQTSTRRSFEAVKSDYLEMHR